ncbi:unnamed protein product [Prunus armeniaca]
MDPIHTYLTDDTLPADKAEAKAVRRRSIRYLLMQKILYRSGHSLPLLCYVTLQQGDYVLREIHEGACGDHSGARSLAFKTKCNQCQRFGSILKLPAEPLTLMVSTWPFAQWGLDLIGPMSQGNGQLKFAVVSVDYFTKWFEAKALTAITATKIEHFVWKNIICRFGLPNAIITDNEAINKIIKKTLKKKLGAGKDEWPEILPEALWAINTSYRRSIGETPFSLTFGTEAVVPVEINAPTHRTASYNPNQNQDQLVLNLDLIEEHRSQAQLQNAAYKQQPLDIMTQASNANHSRLGTGFFAKSLLQQKSMSKAPLALHGKVPTKSSMSADWVPTYCVGPMVRPLVTLGMSNI